MGAGNGTVYAEARWPVNPSTELYLRSDRATELGSLLGGLALFIVCLAVTYYGCVWQVHNEHVHVHAHWFGASWPSAVTCLALSTTTLVLWRRERVAAKAGAHLLPL